MAELDIRVGELACAAKVSAVTINNIKSGKTRASIDVAYRIAEVLGVKVNYISEFKHI
jgi:DNA-binding XRE family transcriptional regulator